MPRVKRFQKSAPEPQCAANPPIQARVHSLLTINHIDPTPSIDAFSQAPAPVDSSSVPEVSQEAPSSGHHVGREPTQGWNVETIDLTGAIKKIKVKVNEVNNLPSGICIFVDFDEQDSAYGDGQGLLAGFLGTLAADCYLFPIDFERWSGGKTGMPKNYFEECFTKMIKTRFSFRTTEALAKRYCKISLGKKWAASRQSLWNGFKNSTKTRDEIISYVPTGMDKDQWARFVQYRMKPSTQELCRRNKENRSKQVIPHTGGSKANSRRRHEIFLESGKLPSRAQLYIETHTRKDGSIVNDAAKDIVEQIEVGLTQSTVDESQVSPSDTVGRVLGPERSGRVRCMGLGAAPANTFRNTRPRLSSLMFSSSGAASSSSCQWQEKYTNLENAFKAYMIMKEGRIPEEMAHFFPPEPHVYDDTETESASDTSSDESGSFGASDMIRPPITRVYKRKCSRENDPTAVSVCREVGRKEICREVGRMEVGREEVGRKEVEWKTVFSMCLDDRGK